MHAMMEKLARLFALLGGLVLCVIILTICASIAGRTLNGMMFSDFAQSVFPGLASAILATGIGPINGDFELVEAGIAFSIFAFLPLCHLHGAHATVDIFTSKLSRRVNMILRAVIEVVFAAVIILIAVQLFSGMLSKQRSGQTTFLIEFPIWWAYALSMTGAAAAAIVAAYVAVMRVIEAGTGRSILPLEMGADH